MPRKNYKKYFRNKSSHFSNLPDVNKRSSCFKDPNSLICSFNVGDLVPLFCKEILPGDNIVDSDLASVLRLQTLIDPIFSPMFFEVNAFFVPNRLIWEHWKNFCGENDQDSWTEQETYSVPQLKIPDGGFNVGTIADFLGVPTGVAAGKTISALPFRAYTKIVNDFYINQNVNDPCYLPINDNEIDGSNGSDQVLDIVKGGKFFVVGKQKDLFTSCLPEPQKGDPVPLPLGNQAPVVGDGYNLHNAGQILFAPKNDDLNRSTFYQLKTFGGQTLNPMDRGTVIADKSTGSNVSVSNHSYIDQTNLVTDLSDAVAANINDLRFSFQLQKILELNARYGSRYIEYLYAHFGVVSSDSRLQRAEWLGGFRSFIDVNQVLQNSESGSTPLGETGAYSHTVSMKKLCRQSFEEHGFFIVMGCVKYEHTYDQGLPKMFSRKDLYDFYDPMLAHIGEQPIFNKEIYFQGNDQDDQIFGYNEAWSHYRYTPNRVAGDMRTTSSRTMASWHLGDHYDTLPTLSPEFIKEDKTNVDRVIADSSNIADQVFGNFFLNITINRVMPLYSIPGLIDHF